ncbi:MAG: type II secretion system protein J [Vulcanimicrobiota bacterium]
MNNNHRIAKGVTLVEIIMTMTILSMIIVLCSQVFTASWKRFHILNVVQDVKMSGIRGVERFGRDFGETSSNYINKSSDSTGLTRWIYFPSMRNRDGTFTPSEANLTTVWKTWIIYYLIPSSTVSSANQAQTFDGKNLYFLARKVKMVPSNVKSMTLDSDSEIKPELLTLSPVITDPTRGAAAGAEICARNVTFFGVDSENSGAIDTYKMVIETWGSYEGRKCTAKMEKVFLIQNI